MIAVLSLTLLLSGSSDVVGHLGSLPPIPITVFAPLDVTDSLVSQMCAETDAIWKPAGIKFEWHRLTSTEAVRKRWLDVTIDERRNDVHEGPATLPLGWIPFTENGPQPSIHLSLSNAEELLLSTPGVEDKTISTHQTLLGRALGRALSHELGHYLLRSKVHTPHGLMRGTRSSEEFFGFGRYGFELTVQEREDAVKHVLHAKATGATMALIAPADGPRLP
jgi:hypothetical protein